MLDDGPTDVALQEYQNKIINTLEEMTANGLSENTIKSATYTLKRLNKENDLMNPENVKLYIGKLAVSTKQSRN